VQIRNSAKALILRDGAALLAEIKTHAGESFYVLPGGGQQAGETLDEAVVRECREELGATVRVERLLFIRERVEEQPHRVEFTFLCSLVSEPDAMHATEPDTSQTGITWIPLSMLTEIAFYPEGLRDRLPTIIREGATVYLGNLS
jgi:8-oxo-dGTP diphosphatase